MGRDQWPTESPISPVSPYFNSRDFYELEDMINPKPRNWNFFFWVAFIVMLSIALFTLGDSDATRSHPVPSPTVSQSSVVSPSVTSS